jgi:prolyl oligopeptidase
MSKRKWGRLYLPVLLCLVLSCTSLIFSQETFQAPLAEDPLLWLEDAADPRTEKWLNDQQQAFDTYIRSKPNREKFKISLKSILQYESYSIPTPFGRGILFTQRLPSENQPVLYLQEGLNGTPRILLDPNKLSEESVIALSDYIPSPNGKLLAYGLTENGSDLTTWKVLDIGTGENRSDCLKDIKFVPIAWSSESNGFYYTRLNLEGYYCVYYHLLGSVQTSDTLVYQASDKLEFPSPLLTKDRQTLMIDVVQGSSGPNSILIKNLDDPGRPFVHLFHNNDAKYSFIDHNGPIFYFWTDHQAPFGKVISIDISAQIEEIDIIPEGKHPLEKAISIDGYFAALFSKDVCSQLILFDRKGQAIREIHLPDQGNISLKSFDNPSEIDDKLFFTFTNFVHPPVIYFYDLNLNELKIFKKPNLTFNPDEYETQRVFCTSKDGTQIPLFIVHKKGLEWNGCQKTILYGYGGFGVSVPPAFNPMNMAWIKEGAIFVLANIRGGSEYGSKWHLDGKKEKKQNCFDDFIAAAEWLIANRCTNPEKLALHGGSNGGLLVGACLNQRPELFGAAAIRVGLLDMLRFPLFTVGRFWINEYGNPQLPEDFKFLSLYSPYHNTKKGAHYPSTIITTGDHDDRVVPLHSYKYTAALQEAQGGKGKVLLRVDRQAGHGAGKSLSKWIDEAADVLSFLHAELAE